MKVIKLTETKGADYTVFYFYLACNMNKLMFRLRTGYGTLKNMTTGEVYIADTMNTFDGVCSMGEFISWASKHGCNIQVVG